jgi:hypothetical protein
MQLVRRWFQDFGRRGLWSTSQWRLQVLSMTGRLVKQGQAAGVHGVLVCLWRIEHLSMTGNLAGAMTQFQPHDSIDSAKIEPYDPRAEHEVNMVYPDERIKTTLDTVPVCPEASRGQ